MPDTPPSNAAIEADLLPLFVAFCPLAERAIRFGDFEIDFSGVVYAAKIRRNMHYYPNKPTTAHQILHKKHELDGPQGLRARFEQAGAELLAGIFGHFGTKVLHTHDIFELLPNQPHTPITWTYTLRVFGALGPVFSIPVNPQAPARLARLFAQIHTTVFNGADPAEFGVPEHALSFPQSHGQTILLPGRTADEARRIGAATFALQSHYQIP